MAKTVFSEVKSTPQFWGVMVVFAAFIGGAAMSILYIEHYGHIVTGMNNQIVWGLPHVFAIFLIVAASGALNVASIGSVFGKADYKPASRLSSVLALALLMGGLAALVLDLGRADRLIIAMTKYNFRSIFAWNVLLYTGFMGVVAVYLYTQMARGIPALWLRAAGTAAFIWRLALTTGTGSIFGWLVARSAYDAAIMAPLFIAMSFSFGLAMFMLVSTCTKRLTGQGFDDALRLRMARLLGVFAAVVLYFTAVQHLSNLYVAQHWAVVKFILLNGGIYTQLFWIGQVVLGGIVPMAILFHPTLATRTRPLMAAVLLVILGGFAQIYVIVVGGQAFPLEIFPGLEVSSSFFDGEINAYTPSIYEWSMGFGALALTFIITGVAMKFLRILPENNS